MCTKFFSGFLQCCGETSVVCGRGLWGAGGADVESRCCPPLDARKECGKLKRKGLVELRRTRQYKNCVETVYYHIGNLF